MLHIIRKAQIHRPRISNSKGKSNKKIRFAAQSHIDKLHSCLFLISDKENDI